MPLQIVCHQLALAAPVVRVSKPGWLFAETINLLGVTLLLCYRSVAVRDTDPVYADVKALRDRAKAVETIFLQSVPDKGIMFGEGFWESALVYDGTLGPTDPLDPRAQAVVDFITKCQYVVHPTEVPDMIRKHLHTLEVAS
ncbi:hypothetical protein KIY73_gp67 [Mycobacterium phage Camperdownii]|uniref:Uncharacterized protein n=1 Tax=Mycobacterium phage Camperdownii TaxID=1927024 RepID=A0A1L5C0Q2_9CAUD|nr:hypothetical protein KIY73_gp67 [Mycobacterium phage Camperdownii]APL99661.1 hypothetical protein SEA_CAMPERDOWNII_67 [Mycobacterium phage Camperdownii]